jgi:hypothetical protein
MSSDINTQRHVVRDAHVSPKLFSHDMIYVFTKKNVYKHVFIRYLESITEALLVLTLD